MSSEFRLHFEGKSSAEKPRSSPVVPPVCNPVTVNWLERCCFSNQLLSPDEHFGDRPLEVVLPIPSTPFSLLDNLVVG